MTAKIITEILLNLATAASVLAVVWTGLGFIKRYREYKNLIEESKRVQTETAEFVEIANEIKTYCLGIDGIINCCDLSQSEKRQKIADARKQFNAEMVIKHPNHKDWLQAVQYETRVKHDTGTN